MNNVVVPTDFSPLADHALAVAASLARRANARLTLLHVCDLPASPLASIAGEPLLMPTFDTLALSDQLVAQAHQQLEQRLTDPRFAGVPLDGRVTTDFASLLGTDVGRAATEMSAAGDPAADLIVMGSHGASGFREVALGSNAQRVVRHAHCPVLVVKQPAPDFSPRRLAYATDFSPASLAALGQLRAFADLFGTEIQLVFVNTPLFFHPTRYAQRNFTELVASHGLTNYSTHVYNEHSEEQGIIQFADDADSDLIVLTTAGRRGLSRLLNGSVAEAVVNHARRPVLVLHPADEAAT